MVGVSPRPVGRGETNQQSTLQDSELDWDVSDNLVGRRVRKYFKGYGGWFHGTITRRLSAESFEVEFEDGDVRKMTR